MNDLISRQAAIDALWKALYEYEDRTEKQFQESDELDVEDWIQHRIFVQNMSDIDRQTIMELPSAQPERKWIPCVDGNEPKVNAALVAVKCGLDKIPSIEPDRKTGRWIYRLDPYGWRRDMWVCSECGEETTSTIMGKPRYLWCPMCGADMREVTSNDRQTPQKQPLRQAGIKQNL